MEPAEAFLIFPSREGRYYRLLFSTIEIHAHNDVPPEVMAVPIAIKVERFRA
jgi:hypothetical protein